MSDALQNRECLILIAHGSKDPRWRLPFEQLVLSVLTELGEDQSSEGRVRLAYMEFVEPTLMNVARTCVEHGVLRLQILPLFLAMGAHLATDIPRQAGEVRAQFPGLQVEVLTPIGEDPRIARLMQQIVLEVLGPKP